MVQKVMGIETLSGNTPSCKVPPVILLRFVFPDTGFVPLLALNSQKSLLVVNEKNQRIFLYAMCHVLCSHVGFKFDGSRVQRLAVGLVPVRAMLQREEGEREIMRDREPYIYIYIYI